MNRITLLLLLTVALLTGCHTSQSITTPGTEPTVAGGQAERYISRVATEARRTGCVTAKVKFKLTGDAAGAIGDMTVSGTLRMKRDDVVQLSLRALGFEVGRLEFTPTDVLLVDRMGKRYVRATYDEVDFLHQAGLDFHALQSLFWNELFLPGQRDMQTAAHQFRATESGDHTLLRAEGKGGLDYAFLTRTKTARIARVDVEKPSEGKGGPHFQWRYDRFETFGDALFPTLMSCTMTAGSKQAGFELTLSGLSHDSSWETRTKVSDKYKRQDAKALFRQILGM